MCHNHREIFFYFVFLIFHLHMYLPKVYIVISYFLLDYIVFGKIFSGVAPALLLMTNNNHHYIFHNHYRLIHLLLNLHQFVLPHLLKIHYYKHHHIVNIVSYLLIYILYYIHYIHYLLLIKLYQHISYIIQLDLHRNYIYFLNYLNQHLLVYAIFHFRFHRVNQFYLKFPCLMLHRVFRGLNICYFIKLLFISQFVIKFTCNFFPIFLKQLFCYICLKKFF